MVKYTETDSTVVSRDHNKLVKVYTKMTEGIGYISGDCECWCIKPTLDSDYDDYDDWVYPDDMTPRKVEDICDKTGKEPRVRYRIIFEVEILE